VPELPEVEITARRLDAALRGATIESTLAPGINALKTFDPPLHAIDGATIEGVRRRGKHVVIDISGDLALLVHLMSAGRLRYLRAGEKGPKTPAFRLRFEDGGELILTEGGPKKRAGVWLETPDQTEAELAHIGPEALGLGVDQLREILAGDNRRLHSLLRDQRALAGIGRAHANEILWEARLSPFRLSPDLGSDEVEALATTIRENLARALELRIQGKGDDVVYRVHGRFGEPCPRCGETLRRVDFEEHTITYCPAEQTGGRILKDRRLSRLLR
jgi:formamidopyrimidine-DNA glycosylase